MEYPLAKATMIPEYMSPLDMLKPSSVPPRSVGLFDTFMMLQRTFVLDESG